MSDEGGFVALTSALGHHIVQGCESCSVCYRCGNCSVRLKVRLWWCMIQTTVKGENSLKIFCWEERLILQLLKSVLIVSILSHIVSSLSISMGKPYYIFKSSAGSINQTVYCRQPGIPCCRLVYLEQSAGHWLSSYSVYVPPATLKTYLFSLSLLSWHYTGLIDLTSSTVVCGVTCITWTTLKFFDWYHLSFTVTLCGLTHGDCGGFVALFKPMPQNTIIQYKLSWVE